MKFILLIAAFIFNFSSYGQRVPNPELGSQAVFTACTQEENPVECTDLTFKNMVTSLITPKISEQIKNSPYKDALDIGILFVSDEEGKVIKEEIEIICENNDLQVAIRNLISRLPAFYPKSSKLKIRKSAHFYNLTFVPDIEYNNYSLAVDLRREKLFDYDSFATFKNCSGDSNCFHNTITSTVLKNMVIPKTPYTYNERLIVSFFVDTDGNIVISKIDGEDQQIKDNIKMAFRKVPIAEPALIKNIPIIQSFAIPIRINIK